MISLKRNRNGGSHLFVELPIVLHVLKHLNGNDAIKRFLELFWVDLKKKRKYQQEIRRS